MLKRHALDNPISPWNRTAEDEPIFVLCGRDILAPSVIEEWAKRAEAIGVNADKVATARREAEAMVRWQADNRIKRPD